MPGMPGAPGIPATPAYPSPQRRTVAALAVTLLIAVTVLTTVIATRGTPAPQTVTVPGPTVTITATPALVTSLDANAAAAFIADTYGAIGLTCPDWMPTIRDATYQCTDGAGGSYTVKILDTKGRYTVSKR